MNQWPFPSEAKRAESAVVSKTVHRLAAAESVAQALRALLDDLDDRSDVRDGSDGRQLPNEAMSLLNEHGERAKAALAKWERA